MSFLSRQERAARMVGVTLLVAVAACGSGSDAGTPSATGGSSMGNAGAGSAGQTSAGSAGTSAGGPAQGDPNGPASCRALPANCGAQGDASCCASLIVPGGTYNRFNEPKYPATVSDFRLDAYEVTVGRFKKFVEVYTPTLIAAGAGKNPNNPSDPGWDSAWNAELPSDREALAEAVDCSIPWATWHGANANRPMNCLTWFEANAFCIWDGGRLPTVAEWSYAAVGGSEQRPFTWGANEPGANADLAVIGDYYRGQVAAGDADLAQIAPVGSVPAGNAKWGHADLIGSVGEWAQDSGNDYPVPCNDCARLLPNTHRAVNGGNWKTLSVRLNQYYSHLASLNAYSYGVRCARAVESP